MNHVGLYALYDLFHSMPQPLQSDKKAKKACRLLNFWTHVPDKAMNIFEKFHVKIKFWSKVLANEIRETKFGTPSCLYKRVPPSPGTEPFANELD